MMSPEHKTCKLIQTAQPNEKSSTLNKLWHIKISTFFCNCLAENKFMHNEMIMAIFAEVVVRNALICVVFRKKTRNVFYCTYCLLKNDLYFVQN